MSLHLSKILWVCALILLLVLAGVSLALGDHKYQEIGQLYCSLNMSQSLLLLLSLLKTGTSQVTLLLRYTASKIQIGLPSTGPLLGGVGCMRSNLSFTLEKIPFHTLGHCISRNFTESLVGLISHFLVCICLIRAIKVLVTCCSSDPVMLSI